MSYQALLFCPDNKTALVVTQVLEKLEFSVEPCNDPFAAVKRLMAQHFDAIVVDCDNEQNATLLFKTARSSGSNQSSLAVAVVEGQAGVAKAFRIGANLVLTKPINVEQSKGTLRVARGLLRKADSAKPATPPAPALVSDTSVLMAAKAQPEIAKQAAFSAAAATAGTKFSAAAASPTPIETAEDQLTSASRNAALRHDSNNPGAEPSTNARPASHMAKEYPWQPVSKPVADPMALALQRAAEAAGKSESHSSPASSKLSTSLSNPSNPAKLSSGGAASATAPAKDPKSSDPKASISINKISISDAVNAKASAAPKVATQEKPTRTTMTSSPSLTLSMPVNERSLGTPTIFSSETDADEAEGSKKRVLIIAAVIIIAIGGYFGWTKLHPGTTDSVQQPKVSSQFGNHPPDAASTSSEKNVSGTSASSSVAPSHSSNETLSTKVGATSDSELEPSSKPSSSTVAAAPEKTVVTKVRKPIVVKSNDSAVEASVQPLSPTELGVASSDKAMAKIVSVSTVAVPRVAASTDTLKISQGVSQGLLLKRVQPNYPQQALHMRIQGAVQLLASVGKTGDITSVKAISGDPLLSRAALDAVKQWKYKPYYLNGEPVAIQTQITMNFKLP